MIGDLFASSIATFLALGLWAQLDWLGFSWDFIVTRASWFVLLPPLWILLMANMYNIQRAGTWRETIRGVLIAGAGGVVLYLLVYFSSEPGSLPRRGVLYFLGLVVLLTLVWRFIYLRVFTAPAFMRRVFIVGAGEGGRTLYNVIQGMPIAPFHTIGFIDDDPQKQDEKIDGLPVMGNNKNLLDLVDLHFITDLIVAIQGPMNGAMFQALLDAQEHGVQIARMPVIYEELLERLPIQHLESDWLLRSFVDELRVSVLYLLAKRLVDIVGGILGVLIFIVTYPWVAIAILLESGRPVLYSQTRLTQGGREFNILKYRSMIQEAESDGKARWADERRDPRATRVGMVLRKTHLDEFPQFLNVLLGDMSLVGPRPERPELIAELEKQIPFYRARLLVKPGIGGWAQINGGKLASVEGSAEKLEFDLYYIKHRSVLLDIWIILRTIGSIIGLKGV
ncbi:MAG: sugar transferase [Anaerolineales bacterium]|jgi:exopolysaccharide biosynthesis polyprenyl glycosylphosphotransferase